MTVFRPSAPGIRRALAGLFGASVLLAGGAAPAAASTLDAVADSIDATSGEPKAVDVLYNDSYSGAVPTITAASDPPNGTAVVNASRGEVVYTSDAGYTGPDSFTYTIQDEFGNTDTAAIDVVVHACPALGASMDESGIVTGEEWIRCSSYRAHEVVGDVTPVMNPTGNAQALFTTGMAENATGPSTLDDTTTENFTTYRGANDVSVLRLDLNIPMGMDCLSFDLSFQTEEYPEYVTTQFNDGFLAELDVSTWDVQDSTITAPDNFAFDGFGSIVSVNSSFFDEDRVVTNTGTEYDGSTPLLEARTPVTPGPHSLYLSIFDATDYSYDSGAYVDRLRAFDAADGTCFKGARQAPNASNDTLTVDEDASGSVNVLTNDVDYDGDPMSVIEWTNGTHGSVSCTTDTCTYTPKANYFGPDSFTYRVSDGGGADTGTVNVTVNGVEDAPVATDDSVSTSEDAAVTTNVLANDLEPDGDPLTITANTSPANGSVACTGNSCTYTPDEDFHGADSFTYTISDGKGNTDTATVNVQVNALNDPPVAVDDTLDVVEDSEGSVVVVANDSDVDGDTLSVTSKTNGTNGSVTCSTTSCTYTPKADFYGQDSFTYTISDGKGGTDTGTVTVSVGGVQDAPVANDDALTTDEDTAGTVNVLADDLDVDRDALSITSNTNGANGTVTCSGDSCTYTPAANFFGADFFTYTISDGQGGSDTATVNVTVDPVNDAPDASGDSLTTDEDVAGQVNVTANDTDVDGDALTISSKTNGSHGTVSCSGNSCTYTPNNNYHGSDSFTYTVSDGGATDTATVDVTVAPVNDAPQANDDSARVTEDTPKVIDVLANDTDVDGDVLSITGKTDGTHGSVVCSTTSCTYTPATDYVGPDSFTYTISDGNGAIDSATVSLDVRVPNVPPVASAAPADASVAEGRSVAFDGTGSSDSDGTIASYTWTVGDGRSFTGATPSIPFGDNGTYDVTLEVCDNDGACDDVTVQVSVTNENPTAVVSAQPSTPLRINTNTAPANQPGAPAEFVVDASDAGGTNDPLTYSWDFGDGTTSGPLSTATVSHAYKKLGTFTATVTVTDGDGGTVTVQSQPVNVLATGKCGKLQKSYWGKPGAKATVIAKTQFWYSKGKTSKPIKGAYIKPGQVVKLQAKPGSKTAFKYVCINKKRYMRVEKVTKSLPSLKNEYLPESALVKL